MLTADAILGQLASQREELQRFGVLRIGLFGSYARGEARDDSDLDFVVDLARLTSPDYFGLMSFLEGLFGRKVDLFISSDLRPQIERRVQQEARYVAGL